MIAYALLRSIAGVALRWFYRRIDVAGLDRLPDDAPMLLVVNHPNALVDALLVAWAIPRRVNLTAKATLFQHRLLGRFLSWMGVVPLVRATDIREAGGAPAPLDPSRNARAFGALRDVLRRGGTVVIFPEGISHDNPSLAPLRTGAARIALEARDEAGVRHLHIVPVGLTFERKEAPRTRVMVQVGRAIPVDTWRTETDGSAVIALTHEIEARLRSVTLNYASTDDASRAATLSFVFASLIAEEVPSVAEPRDYTVEVSLARRLGAARDALERSSDERLRSRADRLLASLALFETRLARHRIALDDVRISPDGRNAMPFVAREMWMILLAGPVALWGFLNHWIPFHAARAIAMRRVESASEPAMRTIVAGAALVTVFYGAQGALVAAFTGWIAALLYLISLPIAADVNFIFGARLRRAVRRARTYLLFRRRPRLHASLLQELAALRAEALDIERQLESARDTEATA